MVSTINKMVGTRWNKVGTGKGKLGLTTLITLPLYKGQIQSQGGPKIGLELVYTDIS